MFFKKMNKTVLVLIGLIYLTSETSFAQCDADHIVILNNFEFVPSELVIVLIFFILYLYCNIIL